MKFKMIQDFGEIEICLYKGIINGKLEEDIFIVYHRISNIALHFSSFLQTILDHFHRDIRRISLESLDGFE